jgi:hypothetical protein
MLVGELDTFYKCEYQVLFTARSLLYIGVARATLTHLADALSFGCPGIRENPTSKFQVPST